MLRCPPQERGDIGINPWWFQLSHTSNLNISSQEATLPCFCRYRVSARTGWPGVSILRLGEKSFSSATSASLWQDIQLFSEDLTLKYSRVLSECEVQQTTTAHCLEWRMLLCLQVVFEGVVGSAYTSDMAIDDVKLEPNCPPLGKCCSTQSQRHLCSFEDRLVGLVVRRPPRERKVPGSNPACAALFSGSSHTCDLNIGTPVATLPDAWRYRVSAGTSRPGVSILWLGEMENLICNFYLSVAACKIDQICPWDTLACCWDVKQPTNKQANCTFEGQRGCKNCLGTNQSITELIVWRREELRKEAVDRWLLMSGIFCVEPGQYYIVSRVSLEKIETLGGVCKGIFERNSGDQNSLLESVLGLLSCLMQCLGFDSPLAIIFPVEGIFPMELTWVLTPFPQNSFRSSLCTHTFHHMDSKDPEFHVLNEWMLATKTNPECTIHKDEMWLPQWLD